MNRKLAWLRWETNYRLSIALLAFTRKTRNVYANKLTTKSSVILSQSAPAAWRRSKFGARFFLSKTKTLKALMSLFWNKTKLPILHETQWFAKKTTICLSRGPMARKKQSREQLTDSPNLVYIEVFEPTINISKPILYRLNLVHTPNVFSSLGLLLPVAKQLNSNLSPIKNCTSRRTLCLWRLGKVKV